MNNLKIGYFADGEWAHQAFKLLIEDKEMEIKFVCGRYESKYDTLKKISYSNNIDYLEYKNINSESFISHIEKYECDLFVSMSFDQIFKERVINLPRFKTINCHAGKLPFYRGRNVLNWVLINDEKEFGITVHYVDEGVDTGDIILQKVFDITDEDNYNTLLTKAHKECAILLYNAIKLIREDKVKRMKQINIHPYGFYCGIRKEGDEILKWNQPSRDIFNFVRAICKPGPMARGLLKGKVIKINFVRLINDAPKYKGLPGQIIGKIDNGFCMKTLDSMIEVLEYEYEGFIKIGDRIE